MAALSTRIALPVLALALAGAARGVARQAAPAPADLIVTAGRIYTVDQSRPLVEAIAIRGDRIVATYIGGKPVYERGADSTAH